MEDTVFQITNAQLLSRVVKGIEELASDGADMMGDIYEYMLGMMVKLMHPTLADTICDPAMGSAGFIMEAAKYIKEHQADELLNIEVMRRFRSKIFHGSDSDASMLRIGCMNKIIEAASTGMKHILSKSTMSLIQLPVPPLSLQQHFATHVEAIEKQKELLRQQLTDAETLMAERMQYYFS